MSNYKPQELFHNRYRLLQHVGVGGMSEIWTAKDEDGADDEVIALKIFSNHSDKNSLKAEYALMRKFNHPNLLRPDYFGVDEITSTPFMVMKYYSKGSVSNSVNNSEIEIKSIDEKLIAQFILSASNALSAIQNHESRIIHQDIKPDNFLINDDGSYVLADFGVSTISRATRQIKRGEEQFSGSTAYVAPERFKGAPPRFSQDIFSLGVTIYEIITGVLPFQDYGGQRLNQGFSVPDLDPAFGYSSRLNALCKRCMDLEPEARPVTDELFKWSTFYFKNGYWPEIPVVDLNNIKAESIFKNASLVYNRLISQNSNTIDEYELNKCLEEINTVLELTDKFPNASVYKDNLESIIFKIKKSKEESNKAEYKRSLQLQIDNLISDADGLISRARNNETDSLDKVISTVENAISKYQQSQSLKFDISVKNKLDAAFTLKEQLEKKKRDIIDAGSLEDLIVDADILFTKVDAFVNGKEFSIQSLKHHLNLINQAIGKYSTALSKSPANIGKKRKKASDLKDIIEKELNKKKRTIFTWTLKLASVLILFLILKKIFQRVTPGPEISQTENTDTSNYNNHSLDSINNKNEFADTALNNKPKNKKKIIDSLENQSKGNKDDLIKPDNPKDIKPIINFQGSTTLTINLSNPVVTLKINPIDNDGIIVSKKWSQYSGPKCIMGGVNSNSCTISFSVSGFYLFTVLVRDNDNNTVEQDIRITVESIKQIETSKTINLSKTIEEKKDNDIAKKEEISQKIEAEELTTSISGETKIEIDIPHTFSSSNISSDFTYQWSISPSRIISTNGLNKSSITIKPTQTDPIILTLTIYDSKGHPSKPATKKITAYQ